MHTKEKPLQSDQFDWPQDGQVQNSISLIKIKIVIVLRAQYTFFIAQESCERPISLPNIFWT